MILVPAKSNCLMFIKKELNEEELRERRLSLDASLKKAEDAKKRILNEKISKLRNHSLKVSEMRIKSTETKGENLVLDYSEFLATMNEIEDLEKFQSFMQKPESLFKASKLVSFIENQCSKESCESVKSRPKVLMSLALLARYPNEVMPNPDLDEQTILEKAKSFYDNMYMFFVDNHNQTRSKEDHEEFAWSWIRTIHAFDAWLTKDKHALFEKMKNEFLIWTKTVGALSINDKSRSEWEPHAVKYQNEILRRIYDTFGEDYLNILSAEVKTLNEDFSEMELIIGTKEKCEENFCKWEKKLSIPDKLPENAESDTTIFEKLKTTNIRILHELMINEIDLKFENILNFSGKSMNEISRSNRENLSKLVSILETESDSKSISNILQELFQYICSSLHELAGDNDDYCQIIKLVDCSIDPDNWLHDSCLIIRWALSMCKKCCAPARDSKCQELEVCINEIGSIESHSKIAESFTNVISLLLDLLNLMRSDFCNFRLKFLASQIEGKGIIEKYELQEFRKAFPTYENTIEWISRRYSNDLNPVEILIDSFISLFNAKGDDNLDSDLPETFYLDIDRIKRYQTEFENLLRKEAGIIYLKNHLKSSKRALADKDDILSKTVKKVNIEKNAGKLIEIFAQSIRDLSGEDASLLKGNINRLFSRGANDKVFSLLKNRELSAIRTILMSEQKISNDTLRGKICSLFRCNKSCFNSIYDEIILKK